MSPVDMDDFIRRAEQLYASRLRSQLEPEHLDEFVAIEPMSGDYYLGKTLSDAIGLARRAHPNCLAHAVRVGHKAAIHFGASMQ
jgi:hypothetical protein